MGEKMKLNRKGFMLAEVVVSASVVAVVLVTMYIGINRMTNAYNKRNKYYDLDAQQVAMEVNDIIREEGSGITFDNSGVLQTQRIKSKYSDITNLFTIYKNEFNYNNNVYIANKTGIDTLKKSNVSESLKNYLEYFANKTKENYSYFIVVELERNSEYYYYTLKVN